MRWSKLQKIIMAAVLVIIVVAAIIWQIIVNRRNQYDGMVTEMVAPRLTPK